MAHYAPHSVTIDDSDIPLSDLEEMSEEEQIKMIPNVLDDAHSELRPTLSLIPFNIYSPNTANACHL